MKKLNLDELLQIILFFGFTYYYFFTEDTHQMVGAGLLLIMLQILDKKGTGTHE